jgi:hypothetical protein
MDQGGDGKCVLTRKLNTFDVTNLVVGAIIGADIYIVVGLSANLIGLASLLAWVLAGVMAMVIALSFAYLRDLVPESGGPLMPTSRMSPRLSADSWSGEPANFAVQTRSQQLVRKPQRKTISARCGPHPRPASSYVIPRSCI